MHPEAITSEAKSIFRKLKNFPGYYLAGGTGLALQIGHRVSVDFDFFSQNHNSEKVLEKAEKLFGKDKIRIVVNQKGQLTFSIQGTEISFINYPFSVLRELVTYQGVEVLSALEIAAMKAYALGRRATFKDYVDLYFVVKDKVGTLKEIINLAIDKHGEGFNPRLFLEQLVYLEDVKVEEIEFLREKVGKEKIRKFFERKIKGLSPNSV